jgi:hypothetical protein
MGRGIVKLLRQLGVNATTPWRDHQICGENRGGRFFGHAGFCGAGYSSRIGTSLEVATSCR